MDCISLFYFNTFTKKIKIMSKPIKETPILQGKDAKTFMKNMSESSFKKIEQSVRERMKLNYNKLKAISQF